MKGLLAKEGGISGRSLIFTEQCFEFLLYPNFHKIGNSIRHFVDFNKMK